MDEMIRRGERYPVPWPAAVAWCSAAPWWPTTLRWLAPVPVGACDRHEARQPSHDRAPLTVREAKALLQLEAGLERRRLRRGAQRGRRGGLHAAPLVAVLLLAAVVTVEGFGWMAIGITTLGVAAALLAWRRDGADGGPEPAARRP